MHKPKLALFAAIGASLLAGLFAGCSHNNNAAQAPAAPAATATTTTTASSQPNQAQNSAAPQSGPPAQETPHQRMMDNR